VLTFLSNEPGSGDNVTWSETLPRDPRAAPTDSHPGSDVSHWSELSVAPWFSMAMCDPNSYPESNCTPESDSNRPTCVDGNTTNCYGGGGSAFMEMQLYPPGMPPFADSTSCDDTHWCAALTIDSLECTIDFATCNSSCEEPVNFAWIQRNGAPTGPPSPQESDLATSTPNRATLLIDGSSYWPEWPTGSQPTAKLPGSFVQQLPTTDGDAQYAQFYLQTDTALSESTCQADGSGCAISAPISPGKFYPYWSRVSGGYGRFARSCAIEFGNVSSGPGVNDFGGDAQYGTDLQSTLGDREFEGPVMSNDCGR
jgi:hypothetical protein